jgi:hypothetical protein
MNRYNRFIILNLLLIFFFCSETFPQPILNHGFPRIAAFNWRGGNANWLSRYDLILGSKNDSLLYNSVKGLNNNVYILDTDDWNIGGPFYSGTVSGDLPDTWRLRQSDGTYLLVYGEYYFADVTTYCGLYNGEKYNQALPRELIEETKWNIYDGLANNGTLSNLDSSKYPDVDLDRNGVNDRSEHGNEWIDQKWQEGQNIIRSNLRAMFNAKWGNSNEKFIWYWPMADTMGVNVCNGAGWENIYINYPYTFSTWNQLIDQWETIGPSPRINVMAVDIKYDSVNSPDRQKDYFRLMRWGLTTALLNDVYFICSDNTHHDWTYYYDEYDVNLGYPTGPAQQLANGCWARFFDNGVSIVNPTNATKTVTSGDLPTLVGYEGPYYRFQGNQDAAWNDGSLFTSVTLTSSAASYPGSEQYVGDGIILVKSPTTVVSDIIVDNSDPGTSPGSEPASLTGFVWDELAQSNPDNPLWYTTTQLTTEDSNYYNSYYAPPGDGSATAVFKPKINVSGQYRVYEWHGWRGSDPSSYNEGSNVPCTIIHRDGSTTLTINQRINYGKWNLIGTFYFNAGGDNSVMLTNDANGYLKSDIGNRQD